MKLPMRSHSQPETPVVWRKTRTLTGMTLIALGVIGTLMPIIPGVPLLFAGTALLGSSHPLVRSLAARAKRWRSRLKPQRDPGSSEGPSNRLSHHRRLGS